MKRRSECRRDVMSNENDAFSHTVICDIYCGKLYSLDVLERSLVVASAQKVRVYLYSLKFV